MRGGPRPCAGSTCRSPACPRRLTASPSPSSATCTSGRRSGGPSSSAVVAAVNGLDADLVPSPATWSTARCASSAPHVAPLADLRSRDGTFFVTGNHEYYSGAAAWVAELRRLGLHGAAQPARGRSGAARRRWSWPASTTSAPATSTAPSASDPERGARRQPGRPRCALLLAHQPRSAAAAEAAGLRPAALRPHPRRPVLPLELLGPAAAAVHRRAEPLAPDVGLHQPRHRLLGPAEALRRAFGDHPAAAGGGAPGRRCRAAPCPGRPLPPVGSEARAPPLQSTGFAGPSPASAKELARVHFRSLRPDRRRPPAPTRCSAVSAACCRWS